MPGPTEPTVAQTWTRTPLSTWSLCDWSTLIRGHVSGVPGTSVRSYIQKKSIPFFTVDNYSATVGPFGVKNWENPCSTHQLLAWFFCNKVFSQCTLGPRIGSSLETVWGIVIFFFYCNRWHQSSPTCDLFRLYRSKTTYLTTHSSIPPLGTLWSASLHYWS